MYRKSGLGAQHLEGLSAQLLLVPQGSEVAAREVRAEVITTNRVVALRDEGLLIAGEQVDQVSALQEVEPLRDALAHSKHRKGMLPVDPSLHRTCCCWTEWGLRAQPLLSRSGGCTPELVAREPAGFHSVQSRVEKPEADQGFRLVSAREDNERLAGEWWRAPGPQAEQVGDELAGSEGIGSPIDAEGRGNLFHRVLPFAQVRGLVLLTAYRRIAWPHRSRMSRRSRSVS